ncbi:MAG: inositol monophosphatase [Chloroflexi bacterium]|nr:inositol monophosphatase [Chloroflexota bacterium]
MLATPDIDALSAHLLEIAARAAREAGDAVASLAGSVAVDQKLGFFDPVTECDRRAERMISEQIFRHHPDSTLIGEEGGRHGDGAVHWFVDPIDGTANFAAGIPFFSVSIAAALGDRLLAGVVYDPTRCEMFAASTAGATLNGEPIRSRGSATDSGATLLTDFPKSGGRVSPGDFERFATMVNSFRAVRRMGSTALHLAYVACGRAEATFSIETNAWDLAAGMLLVLQAGGCYLPAGRLSTPGEFDATRPWLAPTFLATCPELDLATSTLGATIWRDLLGRTEVAPVR